MDQQVGGDQAGAARLLDGLEDETEVEVDGLDGYRSQALCMAVFESSHFNRPVSLDEIERGDLEGYQAQIDQSLGIA